MDREPPILRLSNELLRHIIDQIEPDVERTVPIDARRFLSVESLENFSPPDATKTIGRFRRTCHRFAEVGAPVLFTVVGVRFSKDGLAKLEELAGWTHLARHVKKFSYLMPCFYSGDERFRAILSEQILNGYDVKSLQRKANEQDKILKEKTDARILRKAFQTFRSLQFVKLLPVAEEEDRQFKSYMQIHHGGLRDFVDIYWGPALTHGSQTLGQALLSADVPWSRLYLPVEKVESVAFLALRAHPSLSILAARLTCLTLVFDEGSDLEGPMMEELSQLFRTVFASAMNMQAVHIGFPRSRPVSLALEDIFHEVTWEKLVALGVAGWDLSADEILHLARRHKQKLKGLRLRDVRLQKGDLWKDVLATLRTEMARLQWVSLRRIGYFPDFDSGQNGGAEVPDPWPLNDSESDEEDDEQGPGSGEANHSIHGQQIDEYGSPNGFNGAGDEDDYDSGLQSDDESDQGTDDEHHAESHATDFPNLDSPAMAATTHFDDALDDANNSISIADDLEDDGISVSNERRKFWEQWVVQRAYVER